MYGCPYHSSRSAVWEYLNQFLKHPFDRVLLIGDFNQLENNQQKFGGKNYIQGATKFTEWRTANSLSELPFHGVNFTWSNNRLGKKAIYERLDRSYATSDWRIMFPNAITWNLPILLSDHSPIILDFNPKNSKRHTPYKMEAWCLSKPAIEKIIESC